MAKIADLIVNLAADTAQFRSGMQEANQHLQQLKSQSSAAGDALNELKHVFEGFLSVGGIERIAEFGAQLIEAAADLEHMTRALGISAEAYQSLGFAAQQAGVSHETFARSMEVLSRNLDLVSTGAAPNVARVMADLRLSATNADGTLRSAADTLEDLAHNKIFQAQEQGKKLAEVMILMGGRAGDAALMVNALNGNLDALRKQAAASGLVLNDQTLKGAEQIETQASTLWTKTKNLLTEMTVFAFREGHAPIPILGDFIKLPPAEATPPPAPPKAPGPPVVDPTAARQMQQFREEYQRLLQTYQQDADFQGKLRIAYQQGAAAVRELQIAHAGDEAVLKVQLDAQKEHVKVSQQELEVIRAAAIADKQRTLAAEEQKQATDALAKAHQEYDKQVRQVMDATDGLTKKQNELADALGILQHEYDVGVIPSLDEFQRRAKAAQQVYSDSTDLMKRESADVVAAVERGASAFLDAVTSAEKSKSAWQALGQAALGLEKDLEKLILQLVLLRPLEQELKSSGFGQSFANLLTGGGGAAAAPAGQPITGLASGADFIVGGSGGVDSTPVAFLASPGERVTVTPEMTRGGPGDRGAPSIIYAPTFHITTPNVESFRAGQQQLHQDGMRVISRAARRN